MASNEKEWEYRKGKPTFVEEHEYKKQVNTGWLLRPDY
jgi:hypothetical protein